MVYRLRALGFEGLMKSLILIGLLIAAPLHAATIIVDDAHVYSWADPWHGVAVANFIGKELALSHNFDDVVRAHYLRIEKDDEFNVPGLRFTEEIFDIKDPFILTLFIVDGNRTDPVLKVKATLQQIKTAEAKAQNGPRYSPGGVGTATGIAHRWTQVKEFEVKDKSALDSTKQIAKLISAWCNKQQSLISGEVKIR
jgi:hypothetical protein